MPPSMTATPSSDVAIGRWMNGPDTLNEAMLLPLRAPSRRAARALAFAPALRSVLRRPIGLHGAVALQPALSVAARAIGAWRATGACSRFAFADNHLGAVGQLVETRGHD